MEESSNDGTCDICERAFCCCQSKEKDDLRNQKTDAEGHDHVDHIQLHLLPQEDADGHEHAHDGDGEADIGDGVKLGLSFFSAGWTGDGDGC